MEQLWHQELHLCSSASGSWGTAPCNPHHSLSSAGVNLAEQAEMKSKPMPTGCEVCKESKPRVWDSRALQPNGEMASKHPPAVHRFPNREFILIQVIPWGTGNVWGRGRAASTKAPHSPRALQPGAGLTEQFLSCPTPPGPEREKGKEEQGHAE